MTDLSLLKNQMTKNKKRNSSLGKPPLENDYSNNLKAPETAPLEEGSYDEYKKIDGRTARKTNRTIQLATRVSPEFDREIRQMALKENILIVEVFEKLLQEYKK
jgi:hypothetical protein